jgi:hypothetical protein
VGAVCQHKFVALLSLGMPLKTSANRDMFKGYGQGNQINAEDFVTVSG